MFCVFVYFISSQLTFETMGFLDDCGVGGEGGGEEGLGAVVVPGEDFGRVFTKVLTSMLEVTS